jgi:ABC-2 type transport system permease protein
MNNGKDGKMIFEVAKWEFHRWFKLKDQIITLLVSAVLSLLFFGGKALLEKFEAGKTELVVINGHVLPFTLSNESKINLIKKEKKDFDSQKQLLASKEIDGILLFHNIDDIEVTVNREPVWFGELQLALTRARRELKLKDLSISALELEQVFQQAPIKINYTSGPSTKTTVGEKVVAGIFIVLMLVGIFIGFAYQFVAITGEKQQKITEVIVSAISPQKWIDGKILGISILSLVLLITYSLSTVVFVIISSFFGSGWSIPLVITNPLLVAVLFFLSLGGFFFWNTFFSAIASTINDPNTSARGSLMMIPCIPIAIAFIALGNPDSLTMKILSLFPLTSSPVLSVRLVLTKVSTIEILLSFLFLILSIWALRIAAGKIFSTSILMYGKEPSWKEIFKWLKVSGN